MLKTKVLYKQNSGGANQVDWEEIAKNFSVKQLKVKFGEIKQLSDDKLSRSDKKKLRQEVMLYFVNEHDPSLKFTKYQELENYLKISPSLRKFIVLLRDALQGMATMMTPYVDKNITFEAWSQIIKSRDIVREHARSKAEAIEQAANIFKAEQKIWAESSIELFKSLPMYGKIDALTAESLPENQKHIIARLTDEPDIVSKKTKAILNEFKASEIKRYELARDSYELPEAK